jgi:hypothetical protein
MNTDGSGLTLLYKPGIAGAVSIHPQAIADRILFSSNVPFPSTNEFEIYSVMPDGTEITRLTDNTLYDAFDKSRIDYPSSIYVPE